MMDQRDKFNGLKTYLSGLGRVCAAFSGGVDSAFLLAAAAEALPGGVIAVTARSPAFPARELACAERFCAERGIPHIVFGSVEIELENFAQNPHDRCYLCKRAMFSQIRRIADGNGISHIIEGSNADDENDYRPGMKAVAEAGALSPLRLAGLTKAEIRRLSREMGLDTWDKQAFSCLYTRIPFGDTLTAEKLSMIDRAEQLLLDMGFNCVRVRLHGDTARIEAGADELDRLFEPQTRDAVYNSLKSLGFKFVAADLQGYVMGSMN